MTRIIGRLTSIGAGREPSASRGTAVAPAYWIPVRGIDFNDAQETKDNESGLGTIDAVSDNVILRQWSQGSVEGKVYDLSEGLLLRSLFGAAPTSVQRASSGVYDHTYGMANNNSHLTMTLGVKEANNDLRYPGAVIDSYNFEAVLDDYVRRTINFMARKSASASNTVSYTNETEFIPKHINIKFAAAGASAGTLDSASAIKVRSVTLNIAKNAATLPVLGSTDVDDVVNRQVEISGSIEMYYDDTTYKALWLAGTHQSVRIDVVNSDVVIGSSHNPAIRFELAEIAFTNWSQSSDQNDIATQTLEFKALLNLSLGRSIQARLTNLYAGANYAA